MRNQRTVTAAIDVDDFPLDLLKRRRRLGLSQVELADLMEIDPTLISKWERMQRPIPYPKILHVAILALEQIGGDSLREMMARR